MHNELSGKRAAILVTNGFERSELIEPLQALRSHGAEVDIVSLKKDAVKSWEHSDWGDELHVDRHIDEADARNYDALVLPGGVMNPDFLRMDERAVAFVRQFALDGKLIAAICHGPWTLVEADVVRERRLTSFPSLKTDLTNAGADWVDEEVVVDENFVTSRRPDDLPAFCATLVSVLAGRSAPGMGIGTSAGPGE
ncbi:MAG TPA: type 1 glutamine amidotransferase domain-containing protein [Polyangiaceae bacterium]|nr:type 1 glutamine amidotransferase domain-containing protein [Polyangiaceae bacterium]